MTDPRSAATYSPGGRIVLTAYDAAWAGAFAREATAIQAALADLTIAVHHIGSTAVPGLPAKPVIDILLVVPNLVALDERTDRLTAIGYEARGEFGIAGRRYFHKTTLPGVRTHQIHAYVSGAAAIRRHLDFRDYLGAHPSAVREYAQLKERLAKSFGSYVEGYADAKTAFVGDVERQAVEWRARGSDHDPSA